MGITLPEINTMLQTFVLKVSNQITGDQEQKSQPTPGLA